MIALLLILNLVRAERIDLKLPCVSEADYRQNYAKHLVFVKSISKKKLNDSRRSVVSMHKYLYHGKGVIGKYYDMRNPDASRMGLREALVLDELKDFKHVVELKFCVIINNVMRIYVEELGYTLEDSVGLFGKLSMKTKLEELLGVTNTLHEMQKNNRNHGDIKPENIMLEKGTLTMKLIDFGYSVQINSDIEGYSKFFMPPECGYTRQAIKATPEQDAWTWVLNIIVILFPKAYRARRLQYPNEVWGFDPDDRSFIRNILASASDEYNLPFVEVMMPWIQVDPKYRPKMKEIAYDINKLLIQEQNNITRSSKIQLSNAVKISKPKARQRT